MILEIQQILPLKSLYLSLSSSHSSRNVIMVLYSYKRNTDIINGVMNDWEPNLKLLWQVAFESFVYRRVDLKFI